MSLQAFLEQRLQGVSGQERGACVANGLASSDEATQTVALLTANVNQIGALLSSGERNEDFELVPAEAVGSNELVALVCEYYMAEGWEVRKRYSGIDATRTVDGCREDLLVWFTNDSHCAMSPLIIMTCEVSRREVPVAAAS